MMALFGFGKKKESVNPSACSCQCGCSIPPAREASPAQTCACNSDGITIQVLGTGCASCHALLEHTQEAVSHMGLDANVEYIQDMVRIASYGVMSVPALVVNGMVVSTGKVLKSTEVEAILHQKLQ